MLLKLVFQKLGLKQRKNFIRSIKERDDSNAIYYGITKSQFNSKFGDF